MANPNIRKRKSVSTIETHTTGAPQHVKYGKSSATSTRTVYKIEQESKVAKFELNNAKRNALVMCTLLGLQPAIKASRKNKIRRTNAACPHGDTMGELDVPTLSAVDWDIRKWTRIDTKQSPWLDDSKKHSVLAFQVTANRDRPKDEILDISAIRIRLRYGLELFDHSCRDACILRMSFSKALGNAEHERLSVYRSPRYIAPDSLDVHRYNDWMLYICESSLPQKDKSPLPSDRWIGQHFLLFSTLVGTTRNVFTQIFFQVDAALADESIRHMIPTDVGIVVSAIVGSYLIDPWRFLRDLHYASP